MSVSAGGITLKGNVVINDGGHITVDQTTGVVSIKNCVIGLPEAD